MMTAQMDYKKGTVLFNDNKIALRLRATKMDATRDDIVFFDHDDLLAIVPKDGIKCAMLCDMSDDDLKVFCGADEQK